MQAVSQSLPAMGQSESPVAMPPVFGAEAEKNTLDSLIKTHGEHASVPGAPANATFSSNPIMTTMEMKAGPDALIGNPFENNAGETVFLSGFQDSEQRAGIGGISGGTNINQGISFDDDITIIEKSRLPVLEAQEKPDVAVAPTSSNPMDDVFKFLMTLLASLLGNPENKNDTAPVDQLPVNGVDFTTHNPAGEETKLNAFSSRDPQVSKELEPEVRLNAFSSRDPQVSKELEPEVGLNAFSSRDSQVSKELEPEVRLNAFSSENFQGAGEEDTRLERFSVVDEFKEATS